MGKARNIALNKISRDWDNGKLALLIADLQGEDFDVSFTGFTAVEVDELFKDSVQEAIKEDDFDVDEELATPPITQPGDVWLLGRHRLVCGDSTKADTFETLMGGELANLVVTDPPYNVNYKGSVGKIQNDHIKNEAFYAFLLDVFCNIEQAMAEDASLYVFHADTEGLNFRRAVSEAGFYLSGTCIWKKQNIVLGRSPYQWKHEPILFGWKKKGKHQWYTGRKESTVWEFDKPTRSDHHPTMKPIPLIACEQSGRICRMIELDAKFCDVIVKRYIDQVGRYEGVFLLRDDEKTAFVAQKNEIKRGG